LETLLCFFCFLQHAGTKSTQRQVCHTILISAATLDYKLQLAGFNDAIGIVVGAVEGCDFHRGEFHVGVFLPIV
jgi:hypothetical protein